MTAVQEDLVLAAILLAGSWDFVSTVISTLVVDKSKYKYNYNPTIKLI